MMHWVQWTLLIIGGVALALVLLGAWAYYSTERDADRVLPVLSWKPKTMSQIECEAFNKAEPDFPSARLYVVMGLLTDEGWAVRHAPGVHDRRRSTWTRGKLGTRRKKRLGVAAPIFARPESTSANRL